MGKQIEKKFNYDRFMKVSLKKNREIEIKDLADWVSSSVRYIQKISKEIGIPFERIHGRKHYIWNKETVFEFSKYYDQRFETIDEIPVKSNPPKETPEKPVKQKKVPFRTVKDLVIELYGKRNEYKIHLFQSWAKDFGVPFQYHYGRKYYIITDEVKDIFIELENNKEFYHSVFPDKKRKKQLPVEYSKSKNRDLSILYSIYKEQE